MKTVTLDWKSFMDGELIEKDDGITKFVPFFAVIPSIQEKVIHAFDPLIDIAQSLSYPISFITMAGGMLLISVGQRHRGINMIKWAAIGYIGMQFVPGIMSIVSGVGRSIR